MEVYLEQNLRLLQLQQLFASSSMNELISKFWHLKYPNTPFANISEATRDQQHAHLRINSIKDEYIFPYRHLLDCKHMDFWIYNHQLKLLVFLFFILLASSPVVLTPQSYPINFIFSTILHLHLTYSKINHSVIVIFEWLITIFSFFLIQAFPYPFPIDFSTVNHDDCRNHLKLSYLKIFLFNIFNHRNLFSAWV